MSIVNDLPIIGALLILLAGLTFIVGSAGLPGLGNFDNPVDEIRSNPDPDEDSLYDVSTQLTVGATALGDTDVSGFTYQTQRSCSFCLSIGSTSDLAIGGSKSVKADVTVINQETGKVYVRTTKFLGDIGAGQNKELAVEWANAKPGQYTVNYVVTYDPDVYDISDGDNVKDKTYTIDVPKGGVSE